MLQKIFKQTATAVLIFTFISCSSTQAKSEKKYGSEEIVQALAIIEENYYYPVDTRALVIQSYQDILQAKAIDYTMDKNNIVILSDNSPVKTIQLNYAVKSQQFVNELNELNDYIISKASGESIDNFFFISKILSNLDNNSVCMRIESLEAMGKESGNSGIDILKNAKGNYEILSVYKESSGYQAGLKSKDIIKEINGKSASFYSYGEIIELLFGPIDSVLNLKILREEKLLEFQVRRSNFSFKNDLTSEVKDEILYIKLNKTSEKSYLKLQKILKSNKESYPVILDVRNNFGGKLEIQQQISELFIPAGKVLFSVQGKNNQLSNFVSRNERPYMPPSIILINYGGSQIISGAIKDNNESTILMGEQTVKRGSQTHLFQISKNYAMVLTTGKILRSNGNYFDTTGIRPDKVIQNTGAEDVQLQEAFRYIRKLEGF